MSDFRCPRYWWDGNNWRCQNLPNDYLSSYDFDTYCTDRNRCLECPYMDSDVREKVAELKQEQESRWEEASSNYSGGSTQGNSTSSSTTSYSQPTYSSSSSSDDGCLLSFFGSIIALVGAIIVGLLKILWPVIKGYFFAFMLPGYVMVSWVGYVAGVFVVILSSTGLMPLAAIFIAITAVPYILFWPYWAILMWQRFKKRLTWREVCTYYGKWFLKGPLAYAELHQSLIETDAMPKITSLLGKIIAWCKKVLAKKKKA